MAPNSSGITVTIEFFPAKPSTSCSDEVSYNTFHSCSPQCICTVWFYESISRQGDLKRHFSFMSMLFSGEPHSPKSYPLLSNFTFIHSVVNYRDQSCSICFVLYCIHLCHFKWALCCKSYHWFYFLSSPLADRFRDLGFILLPMCAFFILYLCCLTGHQMRYISGTV